MWENNYKFKDTRDTKKDGERKTDRNKGRPNEIKKERKTEEMKVDKGFIVT